MIQSWKLYMCIMSVKYTGELTLTRQKTITIVYQYKKIEMYKRENTWDSIITIPSTTLVNMIMTQHQFSKNLLILGYEHLFEWLIIDRISFEIINN
jgi:uncharacterized protein YmfQ (DUF2313 family)